MTSEPASRIALSPTHKKIYDRILEILCWIGLAGVFYPLLHWNDLGDQAVFPIHFNLHGEADGWGGRTFLLILPALSVILYIGLSVAEKQYRKFNYPIRLTDNNKNRLYRLGVRMMRHLKPELILIFAYLNNASYHSVCFQSNSMNAFVLGAITVLILATLLFFLVSMAACKND